MFDAPWLIRLRQTPLGVALGAFAWALAVVLLFHRLPFGTSNKDEGYYNAMAYAFALGNRPYVDELAIFQNASLMLTPFYRVYLAITGSGDGIILFNRYLYFAYSLGSSVLAYTLVKRISKPGIALICGALVVSFAYFNILAISYNTTGAFGVFCGTLCTAHALLNPRPGRMLFIGCLFFLSGAFGYPGMAPAVLAALLITVFWLFRETPVEARRSGLLGLAAGAVVFCLAGALFWVSVGGRPGVERLVGFMQAMGYANQGLIAKFGRSRVVFERWGWLTPGFFALFLALPFACLVLKRASWLAAVSYPWALFHLYDLSGGVFATSHASICQSTLPILAPVCVALNPGWRHGRFVLAMLWAPSVVSMLTLTYASSNYAYAACLGTLGATVAGVMSFAAYLEMRAERDPRGRLSYQLVLASLAGSLLIIQLRSLYAFAYAEEMAMENNNTCVRSGPSRGLKTSAALAPMLETVDRDLKAAARNNPEAKSLTVFDDFPVGYLSTRLKPRTFANWIVWTFFPLKYGREIAKENFGTPEQLPDLLLIIHSEWPERVYWDKYVAHRYRPLVKRPEFDYVILKKH